MAGWDKTKQQLASRKHYESNKAAVKARAYTHTKETRGKIRQWLLEYLRSHPCVDCGETDPVILEFDHVRGKKEFNIGAASSKAISLRRVIEEVSKCDVRCANCHRKKTYRDFGHTYRDLND